MKDTCGGDDGCPFVGTVNFAACSARWQIERIGLREHFHRSCAATPQRDYSSPEEASHLRSWWLTGELGTNAYMVFTEAMLNPESRILSLTPTKLSYFVQFGP
jgi:hypothetical protein